MGPGGGYPAPGGHGQATKKSGFNLKALSTNDLGYLVAGLIALIATFLPWYSVTVDFNLGDTLDIPNTSSSDSAIGLETGAGILAALLILAGLAYVAVKAFGVKPPRLPFPASLIAVIIAGLATIIVLLRWLTFGGESSDIVDAGASFGVIICFVALLAMTVFAVLNMLAEMKHGAKFGSGRPAAAHGGPGGGPYGGGPGGPGFGGPPQGGPGGYGQQPGQQGQQRPGQPGQPGQQPGQQGQPGGYGQAGGYGQPSSPGQPGGPGPSYGMPAPPPAYGSPGGAYQPSGGSGGTPQGGPGTPSPYSPPAGSSPGDGPSSGGSGSPQASPTTGSSPYGAPSSGSGSSPYGSPPPGGGAPYGSPSGGPPYSPSTGRPPDSGGEADSTSRDARSSDPDGDGPDLDKRQH